MPTTHTGKREHYRNGDTIHMPANGCDGCCPLVINGTLCHEQGCPDSWRDTSVTCFECGHEFYRTENRFQKLCPDCMEEHQ